MMSTTLKQVEVFKAVAERVRGYEPTNPIFEPFHLEREIAAIISVWDSVEREIHRVEAGLAERAARDAARAA